MSDFGAKNLVKEKTCFKNLDNPSCIDLIVTNSYNSFQNTSTICTGLSDFHKMVVTVLKSCFQKQNPKEIMYRDYKKFDISNFKSELKCALNETKMKSYGNFEKVFLQVLDKHAPVKKKLVRANGVPYMTKALRKAIMRRSQLEKSFYKHRTTEKKVLYKKHKNYCSRLYKRERKKYYNNININNLTDNRKFWNTVKPFLSEKGKPAGKIILTEKGQIVTEDEKVAETLQEYYEKAVQNLDINENYYLLSKTTTEDPVEKAIQKYDSHPSIIAIRESVKPDSEFQFSKVNLNDIEKEITALAPNKSIPFLSIHLQLLKDSVDISASFLLNVWNEEIIQQKAFPNELKCADVTPVFKKGDSTLSKNYRPVSVLPVVSKVFERIIQKQMLDHIEMNLSEKLCGYRKGFNAQHALIRLIEKWRASLDRKGYAGAVLMDLSKAFDTINHDLLIAKLHAYGFHKNALEIVLNYLSNHSQRIKVNKSFSSWRQLIQGVPQGSVLGPILFNIYINDIFYILQDTDICNFADDTTPFACDLDIKEVLRRLEHDSTLAISWFESNYMKLNTDKCHLLISGSDSEFMWAKIGEDVIWEDSSVKLLGIDIDNQLKFDKHVAGICLKAGRKLNALIRMAKFLTFEKRRIIFKAFFEAQFKYCPLVWMLHSRRLNDRINSLQERALRIVYNDYNSSFQTLLEKDGSMTIHNMNLQYLAIEIFKLVNQIPCSSLSDLIVFNKNNAYELRSHNEFKVPSPRTETYGKNSLKYLAPLIWEIIPNDIKKSDSLKKFKSLIKKWCPQNCPCKLCKDYIYRVGYM